MQTKALFQQFQKAQQERNFIKVTATAARAIAELSSMKKQLHDHSRDYLVDDGPVYYGVRRWPGQG